ncbi:Morn repeat domain containing protein [Pandoravirus neocaledonia]|uniref:Morn repeat domain containing protein n=1 Tax=Pandoravirus neocaledonia TaxID=2107708 RepID=A0A2U7UD91_9VIRU|nr:Morn repeat domain containing protein [Pandoravirus neocaledonia]AVK76325.1 Morn repeat domain containing protein [Pandoravirus neocaledonia]
METYAKGGRVTGAQANAFDGLPDELVLAVFAALGDDPCSVLALGATCTRFHALSTDNKLWRDMSQMRFGHPIHTRAGDYGKDDRWVYRAQACVGDARKSVGTTNLSGRIYCGDLVDGLPHGYGVSVRSATLAGSDERCAPRRSAADVRASHHYEGQWIAGKLHGHAVYKGADGSVYSGTWENGKCHGYGTTTNAHGSRHVGIWHEGECPFGIIETANGDARYAGALKNGQPHGHGSGRFEDGASYTGNYANGKRHGYGVHTCANGTYIEGFWTDDALSGHVICVDPVARVRYEGAWASMSMGFGVQSYGDGSRLAALWHGVKHAQGKVIAHRSDDISGNKCSKEPCAACEALSVGTSNLPLGRNMP